MIRFFRTGKTNQPSFKIVVTDKRNPPRAGRYTEEVGFWNPVTKEKVLRQERIKYWLSVGAKPSPTVYNLLISEKIIEGKKIPVHKKKKVKEGSAPAAAAPTEEQKPLSAPAKPEVKEEKPAPEEKKEPVSIKAKAVEEKPAKEPKEAPKAEEPPKEKPKEEPAKTE